jgi:mono/diheme cytochrome c family protein
LKRWLCFLGSCAVAALLVAGCSKSSRGSDQSAGASEAPASKAPVVKHGAQIFAQDCASCHGGNGVGGGVGPSLRDEKSRKSYQAAIAWIEDPKPPMPELYPSPLGLKDIEDVAAYIETL